ncbi:MAG: TatD family hydrolase [Rhodanobacteraceae bacterium]
MSELIDSHSHIDAARFDTDRGAVLERARAAGVTRQIVPAVALSGFDKLRMLCAGEPGLFPAYGLHPMFITEHRPADLDELTSWVEREGPVAVGECGLDFYIDDSDRERQRTCFRRQVQLAHDAGLPLILHARRALDEVIAELRRISGLRGVVHSFSGSQEQARELWRLGFCIGIGGPVTYERAKRLRGIVADMPIEFLLLETDSPDQPLCGHRGERNEPARLADVLGTVATLRNADIGSIAAATTRNAGRVFRLPV